MPAVRKKYPKKTIVAQKQSAETLLALIKAGARMRQLNVERDRLVLEHGWLVRYFSFIEVRGPSDCWFWTGASDRDGPGTGHGSFNPGKADTGRSHRIAYQLFKGPTPKHLDVCHSCDQPKCCNPAHLWLGTRGDNNRDARRKGRSRTIPPARHLRAKGERVHTAKLTPEKALEIFSSKETSPVLAARFGVSDNTIRAIKAGVSWSHVTGRYHRTRKVQPY